MHKKLIVTGGAGFIGSAIIWGLNLLGYDDILAVDELDRLSDEKNRNLEQLKYADLIDKESLLNILEKEGIEDVDAVIHMGACSTTTEKDVEYLNATNYEYTKEITEYCLKNNIRLIYASSAATYGSGSDGFDDDHSLLEKLEPMNDYGWSKHNFDMWALKEGIMDRICGLKYFNVYGPNEYHKGGMRSFVIKAFEQINETGKVRLFRSYRNDYKDGEQMRDFIYIKDAVEMTLFFLKRRDVNGLFNIGTGLPRTWNDLAGAVFRAMGLEPVIEYVEMPEDIRNQYQYYTCAVTDKLLGAGCAPARYSLEDGIEDYVKCYLSPDRHLLLP